METPAVKPSNAVDCPECLGTGKITLLITVKPCAKCEQRGWLDPVLDRCIHEMEISVRTRRVLDHIGVRTLRHLSQLTEVEIMTARNASSMVLREIVAVLASWGLKLKR